MRNKSASFPVGLYGMLLFALAWLTLPRVFAPIERLLVGTMCLVPRICSVVFGQQAMAANRAAINRIGELGRSLAERIEFEDLPGTHVDLPLQSEPVFCSVLAVGRRGGAGQPSELRLDRSYAELAGCLELVTKGDALLGFLLRPGVGAAANDEPEDPARVALLHHRNAPRLYAGLADGVADDDGNAVPLRFVVRAAAVVDPAPLTVDLWDDPYRAAKLERAGQPVHTLPLPFGERVVPGGLLVGHTRIWGYDRDGAETLTIGVFVVPPHEPRALSHVVLWRDPSAEQPSAAVGDRSVLRARRRVAATVYDLPGATRGRHLLVAADRVPDGAGVVQDGLFLGTARGLSFGAGLVTSFVASRRAWSLLLLPDDPDAEPRELHARIARTDGSVAWLQWHAGAATTEPLGPGYLFTGSNGPFCPAGLWIGRAVPHPFEPNLLRVATPTEPGARPAEVFVGEVP